VTPICLDENATIAAGKRPGSIPSASVAFLYGNVTVARPAALAVRV